MNILVFKTNIRYKKQVQTIVTQLKGLDGILRCNVDLYDKDKILRIEARDLSPRVIEHTLLQAGYFCQELQD